MKEKKKEGPFFFVLARLPVDGGRLWLSPVMEITVATKDTCAT